MSDPQITMIFLYLIKKHLCAALDSTMMRKLAGITIHKMVSTTFMRTTRTFLYQQRLVMSLLLQVPSVYYTVKAPIRFNCFCMLQYLDSIVVIFLMLYEMVI